MNKYEFMRIIKGYGDILTDNSSILFLKKSSDNNYYLTLNDESKVYNVTEAIAKLTFIDAKVGVMTGATIDALVPKIESLLSLIGKMSFSAANWDDIMIVPYREGFHLYQYDSFRYRLVLIDSFKLITSTSSIVHKIARWINS